MTALRRPLVAALVLLAAYAALTFVNDTHGFLGTDTGAKVATLEVMADRGRLDPDVGYWAERWDPDGSLHPLYLTVPKDDRWVQVTTLPMLYAGYPLYRLGGYRAALLLPMLGSVGAALAARALARRLGDGDGAAAFWIVGLASPLAVYALDFWEHSVGVALVAWAAVLLIDVGRDARWPRGLAAGALLGAAAALRTEALVYAAVLTAAAGIALLASRRPARAVAAGLAVVVGLAALTAGNIALELATVGSTLRVGRAAGAASFVPGDTGDSRLDEALVTLASPMASVTRDAELFGLLLLAALLGLAVLAARRDRGLPARAVGALVAALYVGRLLGGLDFVPGMVAAAPIVAIGTVHGWSTRPLRMVTGAALAALPLVWAFQFRGGAAPQWGGRYILPSAFLLVVSGVVALPRLARWARIELVALAAAITMLGVAWLAVRSHSVAAAADALSARSEPVLVSRVAHLGRELGAAYGDKPWLTALTERDMDEATSVIANAGFDAFATVDLARGGEPPGIDGYRAARSSTVGFLPDVDLVVVTYVTD